MGVGAVVAKGGCGGSVGVAAGLVAVGTSVGDKVASWVGAGVGTWVAAGVGKAAPPQAVKSAKRSNGAQASTFLIRFSNGASMGGYSASRLFSIS